MGNSLNYERAAEVLVDSISMGEVKAAEHHGISRRTINNYQSRLKSDRKLSQLFAEKKAARNAAWAEHIPDALESTLNFLKRAGEQADPSDPEAIHAVAGAFKLVAEIGILRDVVNARFGVPTDDRAIRA